MKKITSGIIFAAGFGKRMLPLTLDTPKPLIEINGIKMIDFALNFLIKAGVTNIIINTHYLADQIENYINHKNLFNVNIKVIFEPTILETAGAIKSLLPMLEEEFWTINSDSIIINPKLAIDEMLNLWDKEKMQNLMLLQPIDKCVGYYKNGDYSMNNETIINLSNDLDRFVYIGAQIMQKSFVNPYPNGCYSLNVIYNDHIKNNTNLMKAIVNKTDWLHVGDPKTLKLANEYFSK